MKYVAVDVETANADYASICQIGVAHFDSEGLRDTWSALIDPEDYFDGMNVSIHGITAESVAGAPTFSDLFGEVESRLAGQIVVHHMPFDRVALGRAADRYRMPFFEAEWLDSARVARRAWEQFARRGYGLANIARELEISLEHHDALSDAMAAGEIIRRASATTGIDVQDWLSKSKAPISVGAGSQPIARAGDPAGPLYGERVVFTGELSMPRREAAALAAAAGCDVGNSVSKSVTVLVVGTQDLRRTNGRAKSSKHRKAEQLIKEGVDLSIIGEEDFLSLIREAGEPG